MDRGWAQSVRGQRSACLCESPEPGRTTCVLTLWSSGQTEKFLLVFNWDGRKLSDDQNLVRICRTSLSIPWTALLIGSTSLEPHHEAAWISNTHWNFLSNLTKVLQSSTADVPTLNVPAAHLEQFGVQYLARRTAGGVGIRTSDLPIAKRPTYLLPPELQLPRTHIPWNPGAPSMTDWTFCQAVNSWWISPGPEPLQGYWTFLMTPPTYSRPIVPT